jgi:hypothetical protein
VNSTGSILYLFFIHTFGTILCFLPSLFVIDIIHVLSYCIGAGIDSNDRVQLGLHISYLCLCTLVCYYTSYHYITVLRHSFVDRMNICVVSRKESILRAEAFSLRDEVYNLTLEKFNIADLEKNLDLKSPGEKSIAILKDVQTDKTLPNSAFLKIAEVISYLGSSSNLFKPQIEEQIGNKKINLDIDTERWIVGLVTEGSVRDELQLIPEDGEMDENRKIERSYSVQNVGVSEEERALQAMLSSTENWDFDVFDVAKLTKGRPLFFIGMALFTKYDLIKKFSIDIVKLRDFITTIESGYLDKPYHNSTHGKEKKIRFIFFIYFC